MIKVHVVNAAQLNLERGLRIESPDAKPLLELLPSNEDEKATLVAMARKVGLKRAGSAPFSTQVATILMHTIRQWIEGKSVLVALCSSSGPASVAFQFETAGMSSGWATADPFWLQNTLPSFGASAIVNALSLRGQALGFSSDHSGIFSGLYHSAIALEAKRIEVAVIVVAEDGFNFLPASNIGIPKVWKGGLALILCKPDLLIDSNILEVSVQNSLSNLPTRPAKGYILLSDVFEAMQKGITYNRFYTDIGQVSYSCRFGIPK